MSRRSSPIKPDSTPTRAALGIVETRPAVPYDLEAQPAIARLIYQLP